LASFSSCSFEMAEGFSRACLTRTYYRGIRSRCTYFGMIVLSTSVWGCRFCCFMRRRRRRWWTWWWGWNIWCLLRMWGCKFFCF
jgi:hypothetical protein